MTLSDDHIYAVILAGGSGTRFWPKSRRAFPKQLCKIGDPDKAMLELTLDRLDDIIPPERRIIVTHIDQELETARLVGSKCHKILTEPFAKNTAAALTLAALEIKAVSTTTREPVMVSLHADHMISRKEHFHQSVNSAIHVAEQGFLTLLGIAPHKPETGYGYIEKGRTLEGDSPACHVYKVASFREKPHVELAREYVKSKNFFWNTGLFVWQIDTLIHELLEYLPSTVKTLQKALTGNKSFTEVSPQILKKCYEELQNIPIDTAVLEVSKHVAVVEALFDWQDVGSWDALEEFRETDALGNLLLGEFFVKDCKNITIDSDGTFIAALGVKDLVIVASKGAILVCAKEKAQEVKDVVQYLKEKGKEELY